MSFHPPIFAGLHRRGLVEVAPISLPHILSVSVEDHSSDMNPPKRLWSFLDRAQARELQQALAEWLASDAVEAKDA